MPRFELPPLSLDKNLPSGYGEISGGFRVKMEREAFRLSVVAKQPRPPVVYAKREDKKR